MWPVLTRTASGAPIHSYGVMYLLAFGVFLAVSLRLARSRQVKKRHVLALVALALLAYGWGAHLLYLLVEEGMEGIRGLSTASIRNGGLWGGIPLMLLLAGVYALLLRIPFGATMDVLAVSLPAMTAVQKLGCFLGGCCYGAATSLPWGVVYSRESLLAPSDVARHPTQLYDALAAAAVFALAWGLFRRRRLVGRLILLTVCLLAAGRFLSEMLRGDVRSRFRPAGLELSQVIELAAVAGCVLLLFRLRRLWGSLALRGTAN